MLNKTVDEIKKEYDSQGYYDSWRDKSKYYNIITEITQRCIKENISFTSNEKRVLDAGCGTGRNIDLLLRLGAKKIIGVDLSTSLINFAKNKFKDNKNIELFNYNLENKLFFKDKSFDVIICCKTLPHIDNIKKVLNEFNRILKDGGIMILDFYSPYSFRRLFAKKGYLKYTRWDSVSKVKQYLKSENLQLVKVYGERTFMVTEFLVNYLGLYPFFRYIENAFTNTFFNRFSGIYTIVIRKKLKQNI